MVEGLRDLDTALLRSFVAVAEAGSVTAAAHQLNLTQAAVSQQLKRLEDQLELALFRREGRRLVLAEGGERLLARAKRLLALNDEIWQLARTPEVEGELRLGVPHDLVTPYVPPILESFDRAWPRVRVVLVSTTSGELLADLAAGEVDLCVTTEPGVRPGGETLMQERLAWVQRRAGTAARKEPLPLAVGGEDCAFRRPAIRALVDAGRDFRIACDSSHMQPLSATVEADLAVTVLLPGSLPPSLAPVEAALELPALPVFAINLYVRAGNRTPAIEAMAAHIRRHFVPRAAA